MTDTRYATPLTRDMLGTIIAEDIRGITFMGVTDGVARKKLKDLCYAKTVFEFEGRRAHIVFVQRTWTQNYVVEMVEGHLAFLGRNDD